MVKQRFTLLQFDAFLQGFIIIVFILLFNPADCHINRLDENRLKGGQFSTLMEELAIRRHIYTSNNLKWFKLMKLYLKIDNLKLLYYV